jgi:hypothetical protein
MAMHVALLSGLALMAQAASPAPVVLSCSIPARLVAGSAPVAPTERIFRVGVGSFQEWDAAQRKFGGNLCGAFACRKSADRMEGNIGSASVTYTVGIVTGTSEGYWRAVGASGLAANKGPCRVITAPGP